MKSRMFWIIAKKEFFSYLNSAVAYVVLVPFLVLSSFLFFRSALLLNDANLRPFVELLPWFLMIIAPALAMRSFSEEKRKDTTELLFAHPVSEWTIVLGKFIGILMFYGIMLLATIPLPITLALFSKPDWGIIVGQYLGMLAVGGVFLSIGLAASALIGSVVGSFLTAAAVNFMLILVGMSFVTLLFPGLISRIANEIAVTNHITSISRGVIDFRDLMYFGTMILIALTLSVLKLSERKVAELPGEKRKLWLTLTLILAIGITGNVFMYEVPIRLDLTANHRYSLSPGTKKLLTQLPDRATITLYASQNLPAPMQVNLRDSSDWLKDFKRIGKKIVLRTVFTDSSPNNKQEALQKGIREVQFNQIGSNSFQVQTGFLGMEVRFADKTEVIDFIEDSSNLEYQLSRMILKLTQDKPKKIGLTASLGSAPTEQLEQMLDKQYQITPIDAATKQEDILDIAGFIFVDDGSIDNGTPSALLKQYVNNGGNAAVFSDGVAVNARSLQPVTSKSSIIGALKDFGITIKPTLAYDLQLNESVTLGQGAVRYILPYPFWVRALIQPASIPGSTSVNNVLLGWASTIDTTAANDWKIRPLLKTSKAGGNQENTFNVDPNSLKNLGRPTGEQTVGVVAEKNTQRLVAIADADIVSNDFITNSLENQTFIANLVDWVAADPILNQIPRRTTNKNVFIFTTPLQAATVQYVNIAAPAVLSGLFGSWWLWRRRQLTKRVWQGGNDEK